MSPDATAQTTDGLPAGAGWLQTLNYYRSEASVDGTLGALIPVTEDPTLSNNDASAVAYMIANHVVSNVEVSGNPNYSANGAEAAADSEVAGGSTDALDQRQYVEQLMTSPFHAIGLLNGKFSQAGFADAATSSWSSAALDDITDTPAGPSATVEWPGSGAVTSLLSDSDVETPDPLASSQCQAEENDREDSSGGSIVGSPIILQIGYSPGIVTGSLEENGNLVRSCEIDENDYFNSNAADQQLGRQILSASHAIVLIPADPLQPGETYSVNISIGQTSGPVDEAWNFSTVSSDETDAGYRLAGSDGGIFNFGNSPFFGSEAGRAGAAVIAITGTANDLGYWLADKRGDVYAFGDARFYGSAGESALNQPIVGMAATADGRGYWLVAADGGVFSYGDASFYGSTGSLHLNQPIVGMAATADGRGYWLVAADGGVFTYGDASFYGSTGSLHLNQPIVGMRAQGEGYDLIASDGGIFSYGSAEFYGSTGGLNLAAPIIGGE
jgi:hypothetical protein